MGNCLFCGIIKKEVQATIVHETDKTLAFRDVNPKAPVHVLVVPKVHVESLMKLTPEHDEVIAELHRAIQSVARHESLADNGFRVIVNNGKDSGQAIGHLHYHVLGGRKLGWPHG